MSTEVRSDHAVTDDLRVLVTAMLCADHGPSAIQTFHRARSVMASSYPAEVVTVGLAGGSTVTIYLKDLSTRRYDSDLAERRSREIAVYRDLLADANLDTAHYYGSVEDPARNRFWLLLEHVAGSRVDHEGFEVWVQAAAWLGRMQAHVAAHPELLSRCAAVRVLTTDFYRETAAAAERAAAAYGAELGGRVGRAVDHYADLVAALVASPPTLVHGGYRPQNILLRSTGEEPRICPLDWEEAALGPAAYDLAYLSDGFDDRHRRALIEAYRMEADRHGLRVPEGDDAEALLDVCNLHKNLGTLSKAVDRDFPLADVQKLVRMIEEAADRTRRHPGRPAPPARSMP